MPTRRVKVWRISPGKKGFQWDYWKENEVIAVGHFSKYVRDLAGYSNPEEIKLILREIGATIPAYHSNQLWLFARLIQRGDLVIAYRNLSIIDIGLVISDCIYEPDEYAKKEQIYSYRRKVKWFGITPRKLAKTSVVSHLSQNKTVFEVTDTDSLNFIKDILSEDEFDLSTLSKLLERESWIPPLEIPPTKVVTTTTRIIRDSKKSSEVKSYYNQYCQICSHTIDIPGKGRYSETHHIKPLSKGGPDSVSNMLCLCPNHHVEMDYGALHIDPQTMRIIHSNTQDEYHGILLAVIPLHTISKKYLTFHVNEIYSGLKI